MVIRRSASAEIRQLVERLVGGSPVEREAAGARLAIMGPRAVGTLLAALEAGTPQVGSPGRAAILRTLEAIGDPRAVAPAAGLIDQPDVEVASAAVGVLRGFLRASDGTVANAAFERLTLVALDSARPEPVRADALEALADLPPAALAPVMRELQNDPSPRLRSLAEWPGDKPERAQPQTLAEATAASRCPDPADLRAMLARDGAAAPLPVLGKLVDMLRARESEETSSPRRTEWQAARAAVHQALAARGSRLALYDLRETLAFVPGPLPVGFVAALEVLADASCLDDVAAAYVRARQARDDWWTEHLAAAFKAILSREKLTRRSSAVRRVTAKWPLAAEELLSTPSRGSNRRF